MADKTITALPAAAAPLAGIEVLPIVQSGATVKVSVADLTAERDVTTKAFSSLPSLASGSNFATSSYDTGSGGANVNVSSSATNYNNDGYGDGSYALYARGTVASPAAVQSGDDIGYFGFAGYDGTGFIFRSWSSGRVDGAVSANVVPTAFVITSGSAGPGERMRFTSAGNAGLGTSAPNAAAQLDVASTTRGFLPPRMTEAQRDAIATPPDGLILYNTTANKLQARAASAWVDLH